MEMGDFFFGWEQKKEEKWFESVGNGMLVGIFAGALLWYCQWFFISENGGRIDAADGRMGL